MLVCIVQEHPLHHDASQSSGELALAKSTYYPQHIGDFQNVSITLMLLLLLMFLLLLL